MRRAALACPGAEAGQLWHAPAQQAQLPWWQCPGIFLVLFVQSVSDCVLAQCFLQLLSMGIPLFLFSNSKQHLYLPYANIFSQLCNYLLDKISKLKLLSRNMYRLWSLYETFCQIPPGDELSRGGLALLPAAPCGWRWNTAVSTTTQAWILELLATCILFNFQLISFTSSHRSNPSLKSWVVFTMRTLILLVS